MKLIYKYMPNLEQLHVMFKQGISEEGFESLAQLSNLKKLQLSNMNNI